MSGNEAQLIASVESRTTWKGAFRGLISPYEGIAPVQTGHRSLLSLPVYGVLVTTNVASFLARRRLGGLCLDAADHNRDDDERMRRGRVK